MYPKPATVITSLSPRSRNSYMLVNDPQFAESADVKAFKAFFAQGAG